MYERDGVVVLRNVLPSELIEELAKGVRANMDAPSEWANEYTPTGSGGRFSTTMRIGRQSLLFAQQP